MLRETRTIPKVVYEMEQFSRSVIQLSNKTKVDLAKRLGPGTARDFRILNLREVLEHQGGERDVTTVNTQSSTRGETEEEEEMEVDEDVSDEETPSKRARISQ